MSQSGAHHTDIRGRGEGMRIAVVASSWHAKVMDGLIDGAVRALEEAGANYKIIRVPGSFELSLACHTMMSRGVDGAVALGVVIRGGTPHFDYVCEAATNGLTQVALESGKPVGFGLLTCDTEEQALDRAGLEGSSEDKGWEAAAAVIEMVEVLRP